MSRLNDFLSLDISNKDSLSVCWKLPLKNFFTPKEEKSAEQPQEIETVGTEPTYKIAESLSGYDFDNNYFEEAFAKDESSIKPRQDTPSSSDSAPEPPDNLPLSR